MARTETVFKMSIDDGNSVNTLKDLDKNSSKLKKSMDDLAESGDKTSDEFKGLNQAYEETIDTQKKLMGDMEHLGDDILVEVSGSISKMEDRLYELALSGDTVSKEFVDLQNKTANYKKIIIETDRSVDALAEQGRGLSTALSISSGAVAGFQAFTGVTALMGTENEELLETITKLQAAQGILNSIEVIKQQLQNNSIALTRARTKVQKLYNLAIGSGTKGMKLFRAALLATGIGALIIGVTLLIANFGKLKDMLTGVTAAQKLQNEISNKALDAYAEQASAADQLRRKLDDQTLSREDQITAVKKLQEKYPDLLSNIDAESASVEEVNRALVLNVKLLKLKAEAEAIGELRAEKFKERLQIGLDVASGENIGAEEILTSTVFTDIGAAALENSIEEAKAVNAEMKLLDDQLSKTNEEIDKAIKEGAVDGKDKPKGGGGGGGRGGGKSAAQIRIEEETKAALELSVLQEELRRMTLSAIELEELAIMDKFDALAERAKDNAAALKQINEQQEVEMNVLFEKRKEAEKINQEALNKIKEDAENKLQDRLSVLQDEYLTEANQREINKVNDKYFELILLAEENGLNANMLREQQLAELALIEQAQADKLVAIEKKKTDEKKAIQDAYFSTVTDGLNAISGLNDLVSGIAIDRAEGDQKKQEKIAKRSFNLNKALQLSIAGIQAVQAVQNAFMTASASPLAIVNPAYPFIQASIAGVVGATNIAKIASSKYKGSAPSPGVTSGGSAGASASAFNISDDTSSAQTNLNADGSQVDGSNGPTQVYVSEIDISNVQNGIEQIEVKSTF